MKKIKKLVNEISEEVCSAEEYAEKYLEYLAEDKMEWASHYREMAQDELKHADYLHEIATDVIQRYSRVFNPPLDMKEKWDKTHEEYVEKVARVKTMINL